MKPFKVNSQWIPENFPRDFDAHIYFTEESFVEASELQLLLKNSFDPNDVFVGDLIPKAIGPHPVPMFEANFTLPFFDEMIAWLNLHRGRLSILVHPLSGNGLYDHTDGAIWLGEKIALNLSIFEK